MKRKITFLVVAVLCLQTLLAQNKTIRGTIVDSFSEPIIGASAHVKGTYTGTISDLNGNYTLENVPEDAVITFSYIGMIPQEIAVKGKNVINVQLKAGRSGRDRLRFSQSQGLDFSYYGSQGGSVTFYSRLFTYGCHARESGRSKCNQ